MNSEILTIATAAVQRYAETHPRPPHVNQAQAAAMLGISPQTMGKLVRNGTFKLNKCGLIPITQIDDALAAEAA
ncbi:MAG: hypothetical protein WAW87_08530 [Candidatus Ferrigenium altingense]